MLVTMFKNILNNNNNNNNNKYNKRNNYSRGKYTLYNNNKKDLNYTAYSLKCNYCKNYDY